MKIIHVSYNRPRPRYKDPWMWIKFLRFFSGELEALTPYAEINAIYHIDYRGVIQHNGVYYHFPGYKTWQLWLPFQFNGYIRRLRPDVVVVHGLIFPFQVLMLRWQLGTSTIIIAQHHAEGPLRDIRKYLQRWADRYIKAYLFSSFDLGLQWVRKGQISDAKKLREIMEVSSPFSPMPKANARKFTQVQGQKVFLWVGRLERNKDPLTVLKAFIRFGSANGAVRLYMIFQSEELLDEIKMLLSATTGAGKFIHLIGKVDNEDLRYWYNSADFIVSGSHYEGGGIAVCEAMSCGCIPVLTNIPSFRTMTDNGRVGLLYEAGNENALLATLQKSLALDHEDQKRKVLERFRNELSFEAIARKVLSVINEP